MRGHSGLFGVHSLGGAAEHQRNTATRPPAQRFRIPPSEYFGAADRLERLAGSGATDDPNLLLRVAALYRNKGIEIAGGMA